MVKGRLQTRNIVLRGRRTSIRLEPDMWDALHEICRREGASINALCTHIAETPDRHGTVTAGIRVFIVQYFRAAATEGGHARAGHGGSRRCGGS